MRIINGLSHFPVSIAYNPRGSMIACSCTDNHIYFFSVYTRALIQTIYAHASTITSLAFSSNGSHLLSSSVDGYWFCYPSLSTLVASGTAKQAIACNRYAPPPRRRPCGSSPQPSVVVSPAAFLPTTLTSCFHWPTRTCTCGACATTRWRRSSPLRWRAGVSRREVTA